MMTYIPLAVVAILPLLRPVAASPAIFMGSTTVTATVTVTIPAPCSASTGSGINANPILSSVTAAVPTVTADAGAAAAGALSSALAVPSVVANSASAFVSGAVSTAAAAPSVVNSAAVAVASSAVSSVAGTVAAVGTAVTNLVAFINTVVCNELTVIYLGIQKIVNQLSPLVDAVVALLNNLSSTTATLGQTEADLVNAAISKLQVAVKNLNATSPALQIVKAIQPLIPVLLNTAKILGNASVAINTAVVIAAL